MKELYFWFSDSYGWAPLAIFIATFPPIFDWFSRANDTILLMYVYILYWLYLCFSVVSFVFWLLPVPLHLR